MNSQSYIKLSHYGEEEIPSSSIQVGDFIKVRRNQRVPADCILLRTTEVTASSFIRTDQLDGETDWKLRSALPYTQSLPSDSDLLSVTLVAFGISLSHDALYIIC